MKTVLLTSLVACFGLTLCLGCGSAEPVGDDEELLGSEESGVSVEGHDCWKMLGGATGREPNGQIPVCCRPTASEKAVTNEVLRILNDHRRANGRVALLRSGRLDSAMTGHLLHQRLHPFNSHYAPEAAVNVPWLRGPLCNRSAGGENLAWGHPNAAAVMNAWKNSGGHNQNMLEPSYRWVGLGYVNGTWGQIFGQ
ncbi:MAG: CAP domain-containing protein [Polyangiaceae bacterium]|nr:CAP domain-containing protein [Polyangiaceae bacterium]